MGLSLQKIKDEVLHPSKQRELGMAKAQQDWIKFHVDTNLDAVNSLPFLKFKAFVKSQLPEDKYITSMNNLKFPLPTNSLTEGIFTLLSKIFDGRNPAFNYQFHRTHERDDWEWYRQEVLDEPNVWSQKAWRYFQTEINCVMVVDMPLEDKGDRYPQPYFYFVPISEVISYEVNPRTKNMNWIIFKNGDVVIAIDDTSYRTFAYEDRQLGELLTDNPHDLGYCPSRFFWSEPLSLSNPDIKKSPISKELSALDWYLFKSLGVKHLDTYASYPIYSAFEEECDYIDKDGNACHKGYLQKPNGEYVTGVDGTPMPCPICHGKKQLMGAGSFITVPVPTEGQPDLRKPVDITTVDRKSLDYNVEELKRLETKIVNSCVGVDNTILNETSLADKQVDASFESKDNVLNRIKQGFEEAQEWVDTTICLLRYRSAFISASINYGNEFYTLTPETLQKRYTAAKEGGASEAELDALRTQLIETTYRHNPMVLQRMLILNDLEPYRHRTQDEVKALRELGLFSDAELILKADFMGFVKQFERENDNILEFGTAIPYSEKIKTIYQTLLHYAEQRAASPSRA
jgi:hypothetical protein